MKSGEKVVLGLGVAVAVGIGLFVALGGDDAPGKLGKCTEVRRGEYRRQQYAIESCGEKADGSILYVGVVLIPMQEPVRSSTAAATAADPQAGLFASEAEAEGWARSYIDSKLGPIQVAGLYRGTVQ